jgi:hypothetical protein
LFGFACDFAVAGVFGLLLGGGFGDKVLGLDLGLVLVAVGVGRIVFGRYVSGGSCAFVLGEFQLHFLAV